MLESAQNKLYDPRLEHDACGIGAVVSLRGIKTHQTVDNALKIVESWNTVPARMPPERPVTAWAS